MSTLTRRSMIGTTAGVAGASLANAAVMQGEEEPAALKGTAKGNKVDLPPIHAPSEQGGEPPNPEPMNNRLGVAVVGLGHLSLEQILPGFGEAKHVRVTALVSGDKAKAKVLAGQYGVPEKSIYDYQGFDKIKNDESVDIVYVVLPNSMHAEYTVRAAEAGKHVLCEKPMATSVQDCQRMVDACDSAKRKLMIAYRLQYNPAHRAAIKMARSKQFGDLRFLTATNGQNDLPDRQWRQIRSLAGGGSLPDVGLYCLSAFRYITGEEPYEVTGQITQPKNDSRFAEIEDVCTFTLRFPSGVFASGSSGYSFHENRHLRMMAESAWFGLDPAFGYNNLNLQIGRKEDKSSSEEQRRFAPHNQFATEMDDFAQRIRKDIKPLTPGEEGLQDQKIIEAIYQSAKGGSPIKLPLTRAIDSTRGPAPNEQTS